MNNQSLPPLPPPGAAGPEVCDTVRLYLAVRDNISLEQLRIVTAHVQFCATCTREQRLLLRSTQLIASLAGSEPSAHVDQAVMAAIAARFAHHPRRNQHWSPLRLATGLAAAAVVLLAVLTSLVLMHGQQLQGFALPANLSWSSYVLYHKQTMSGSQGEPYAVVTYDNIAAKSMNVETLMNGQMDVVAVKDQHEALGMDMMHHVAQWGAKTWFDDDAMFDLAQLRSDLQTRRAVYLGTAQFAGQKVYRVRAANGDVLLLDTHYMPVNVLENVDHAGNGKPMYDVLQWLPPSHVPDSMWNMQVPPGFTMGQLPPKP